MSVARKCHDYVSFQISFSHEVDEPVKKIPHDLPENTLADDESKKKKKRSEKKSVEEDEEPGSRFESGPPMSESYMGGRNELETDCPLLDAIERRCRGIDILSGDFHQNLLEACGIHQLCYLCVSFSIRYFNKTSSNPLEHTFKKLIF